MGGLSASCRPHAAFGAGASDLDLAHRLRSFPARATIRAMTIALTRRLFTADEYDRLGAAGILSEDDRVELLFRDM